jgi:hypothetical protein
VYRTVSSVGSALLLGIGKHLPLLVMQLLVLSMLFFAVILYVWFQRTSIKIAPLQHLKDDSDVQTLTQEDI